MSVKDFALREQVCGYAWTPYSIIVNEQFRLKVASAVMYDWAHCYVCDGLVDAEFGTLMHILRQTRCTYAELGKYVGMWTFPKSLPVLSRLFGATEIRNALRKASFTCTASEMLTLAPVLARYMSHVCSPRGEHLEHIESLRAGLHVLEILQDVKRRVVSKERLQAAIHAHLQKYVAAYGRDAVRPKHHYVLHLPDMLDHHGVLLSTLMHERKHRMVKRYTKNKTNLRSFERTVMEEVTCFHVWECSQRFVITATGAAPRGRTLAALGEIFPDVENKDLKVSNKVIIANGTATKGDFVLAKKDDDLLYGEILANLQVQGHLLTLLSVWQRSSTREPAYLQVQDMEAVQMVPTASIVWCFTAFIHTGGACLYVPPFLRD